MKNGFDWRKTGDGDKPPDGALVLLFGAPPFCPEGRYTVARVSGEFDGWYFVCDTFEDQVEEEFAEYWAPLTPPG